MATMEAAAATTAKTTTTEADDSARTSDLESGRIVNGMA